MKCGVEESMLNWVRSRSVSHTFSSALHISDALWGQTRSLCCNSTHKTSAEAISRRFQDVLQGVVSRSESKAHLCRR